MLKLKILSVGKTKEEWLDKAIEEYVKRLQPILTIEFIWAKNDSQLLSFIDKEPSAVCLDAAGEQFTSEQFSNFLQNQFVQNGSRLTLVIGSANGLPEEVKKRFTLISLSLMTMTHQIIRLVLLEQIYRAFEIKKGSKYHK